MGIMETLTMEIILSVFKNYSDKKRLKDIKSDVVRILTPEGNLINENQPSIEKEVEDLIKLDKKLDNESFLTYSNGYYKKRKGSAPPHDGVPTNNDYIGIAGECAVMSELMFRGYNANRMMIDEGVDIVAVKNNIYYYVQVKTTFIKDGRIRCHIGIDRYNQYIGAQIRYFVVARYKDKGIDRNIFFMFTPQEIDKGIYQQCIKRGDSGVSIKIAFSDKTGEPYLYDIKDNMNIAWNMNRFDL